MTSVVLLTACATVPGQRDPFREAAVRAGVPADDIAAIRTYDRETESGELTGYEAWVQLESCPGFVILELDTDHAVRDAYVRGDCAVPGLSAET
jgi:hypothetical protein